MLFDLWLSPLSGYGVAAVMNVTLVDASSAGFVTAYSGPGPPATSNINAAYTGQTIANLVSMRLVWFDQNYLYSQNGADLIVDLQGAYTL